MDKYINDCINDLYLSINILSFGDFAGHAIHSFFGDFIYLPFNNNIACYACVELIYDKNVQFPLLKQINSNDSMNVIIICKYRCLYVVMTRSFCCIMHCISFCMVMI